MIQQGAFETVVLFSRPKKLLQRLLSASMISGSLFHSYWLLSILATCAVNCLYQIPPVEVLFTWLNADGNT